MEVEAKKGRLLVVLMFLQRFDLWDAKRWMMGLN